MGAMTTSTGGGFTVADLHRWRARYDDGRAELLDGALLITHLDVDDELLDRLRDENELCRVELLDGAVIVTPAPGRAHQTVVLNLAIVLKTAAPADCQVLVAPFDVRLAPGNALEPDVVMARREDFTERNLPAAPVLVVEVLSPFTRRIDLTGKLARYRDSGVLHYWTVDPLEPSLIVRELQGGEYVEVGHAIGEDSVQIGRPCDIRLCPADLARG